MHINWPTETPATASGLGRSALLVADPGDSQRYAILVARRWDRLWVRLFASALDRQLAAGRSPEDNRLLACRARSLVSPAARRSLAAHWEHLMDVTRRPPTAALRHAPPCRARIGELEAEVGEMLTLLRAPLPTPARGVAMVHLLLGDGTGPLWNRHCPTDLRTALREAIDQLDPAIALAGSA